MPLLTIIGCELFKKEIAQVLINDGAIENLLIVNGKSSDFKNAFEDTETSVQPVFADSIPSNLKKSKGFNVLVTLQIVSLNSNTCNLNREIYEKIKFYGNISDGILLLYCQEDDELENMMSAFKRSKFCFKSIGNCADCTPGEIKSLSSHNKPKEAVDKKVLEVYESLYADMKAELGQMGQLA